MLKKNTIKSPRIRSGPNGISLFIVMVLLREFNEKNSISAILTIAPIQKESNIALAPNESPRNQPMPNANLASPKPIHLPIEINHKIKNGKNNIGPEKNESKVGIDNSNVEKLKNIPKSASPVNV